MVTADHGGCNRRRRRAGTFDSTGGGRGSRLASSSRVLMLRNASASSSKGTSTTRSAPYHRSILRCPEPRNAQRRVDLAPYEREHGCAWSPVFATASWASRDSSAARSRAKQIAGEEGRIARHRDDKRRQCASPRSNPASGAGSFLDLVLRSRGGRRPSSPRRCGWHSRGSHRLVWSEALEHVRHHRPAAKRLQPLVHAAHARALAAGQHHARDGLPRRRAQNANRRSASDVDAALDGQLQADRVGRRKVQRRGARGRHRREYRGRPRAAPGEPAARYAVPWKTDPVQDPPGM